MDPVEFDMAGPGESETDLQSYILSSQMAGLALFKFSRTIHCRPSY